MEFLVLLVLLALRDHRGLGEFKGHRVFLGLLDHRARTVYSIVDRDTFLLQVLVGLDSSFATPTAGQVANAKAAGIFGWSGYLATRPNVGLAHPWTQADFQTVLQGGLFSIAFCSGYDDPVACKNLAAAWGVKLCLDVEGGIRGDGSWVQPWLDASGAGLYGNEPVHPNRNAAFHILAAYFGSDPNATWYSGYPRPSGPVAWQWRGTHNEFGATVDRGWYDDWFKPSQPKEEYEVQVVIQTLNPEGIWALYNGEYFHVADPGSENGFLAALNTPKNPDGTGAVYVSNWSINQAQHDALKAAYAAGTGGGAAPTPVTGTVSLTGTVTPT